VTAEQLETEDIESSHALEDIEENVTTKTVRNKMEGFI
jgi:hypothetical protein